MITVRVIHQTLIADELTPVSAFARLSTNADRAFLFESVVGGERVARYSFIGVNPTKSIIAQRDRVRITDLTTGASAENTSADPLADVEAALAPYQIDSPPAGLPRFIGGAVGYAAYDTIRYYERLPDAPADDRGLPDVAFDIYESLIIFDHARKLIYIVAIEPQAPSDSSPVNQRPERPRATAAARIDDLIARLSQRTDMPPITITLPPPRVDTAKSNMSREQFESAVESAKNYIRAGDIFQVVLSQRFETQTAAAPFDIYRALRVVNPSPFMFYLKTPEVVLIGSSPEILCRVEDRIVTNRPLAGTRRRGATDAEDQRLKAELLADPKERAEHIMLVDLGRNDVGRVARLGSVQLSELMTVEYYSHVMHISSTVTGELAADKSAFDALRATLPVGTVSGAPKVRAMQIIDELEPTRRGPYGGAVGYIDFAGNMDTCIALRTMVATKNGPPQSPWTIYVQAGAGIVADSIPASEFEETRNKAQAMLSAIRVAEEYFA